REDKPPKEVVREQPADARADNQQNGRAPRRIAAEALKPMAKKSSRATKPAKAASSRGKPVGRGKARPSEEGDVRFTHPERVYWADVGVTKQDLAEYYRGVWTFMAPQVVDRPLALVRCPEGTSGECFFQKHAAAGLEHARLKAVIDKKRRQVIAVED